VSVYLEKDLYEPVKRLFEGLGFAVKAEVLNCDMVAVRGDDFISIELKSKLNLDVILQAVDRQKIVEQSYLAVPEWGLPKNAKRLKAVVHLLKRLELGLVIVSKQGMDLIATIESDAVYFDRIRSMGRAKKKQLALKKEFNKRLGDDNVGGTTRTKRMTAYRQDAIAFALLIAEGHCEVRGLVKEAIGLKGRTKILSDNHYGWFEKLEKGKYALTEAGKVSVQTLDQDKKIGFLDRVKIKE